MLGLFGALDLGARSLRTQQQGVEVAGHNLANVNNPAYARQRVSISTASSISSSIGPQGSGAEAVAIVRVRSSLLDQQIQTETSVNSALTARQSALEDAQSRLGERIGSQGNVTGIDSSAKNGIAQGLSSLFTGFQSLAASPTSDTQRVLVRDKAIDLANKFKSTDQQLADLGTSLNASVQSGVDQANGLLNDIASLNKQITTAEIGAPGAANDLRDLLQQKQEQLSQFVRFDSTEASNGAVNVTIGGVLMVSGNTRTDSLQTFDSGNGQLLVRTASAPAQLALGAGSIAGAIEVRDTDVAGLRKDLNTLAAALITQVNAVHAQGFGSDGTTGNDFFTGTGSSDIGVNPAFKDKPSLIQASDNATAAGNNKIALALGALADAKQPTLGDQTFQQSYAQTVAELGQKLSSANNQLADQQAVQTMLSQQRDSISGVSVDEELTDLTKFQKAFQASARLISTVDDMLDTIISMKR
ncbi:MAG: Flagellar hook-associated protein FlgK [Verrucomicrobiales bacterium]|nr:Flagellar hook-associated protein FlgK [Verrucomicrobiales bacterium]